MRIVLLSALFFSFLHSGLIQKSDFKKYETFVNSITFNQKNKIEMIENAERNDLIRPQINEEPLLYIAAKYRKEGVFKKLLQKGMNPNVIFKNTTLLHYILKSRPKFLELLDLDKINFLTPNKDGDIPINLITERYNLDTLKPFLERIDNSTTNLETKNVDGLSFLHLLIENSNVSALEEISKRYKIKEDTSGLLTFAFDKDISMFNLTLNMVEDNRVFFVKNKDNIISYLLQIHDNAKTAVIRDRAKQALSSVYGHLKEKDKLELLYSVDENGESFVDLSIKKGEDTLVELFYEDRLRIPLGYDTLIRAIDNGFKNPKIFEIIEQHTEDRTVFHEILKNSDTTANTIPYLPLFDYAKLNIVDRENKEHFLYTALSNKRWDFIYSILTLDNPDIEISNQYIVKMLEANILLGKKLMLNKDTNPKVFNRTFLFYLINSNAIRTKEKEDIIKLFITRHVRTKKQLDFYFFENSKMNIKLFGLLKLKIPGAKIIDYIEELKMKPEEEPFMTLYKDKKMDDFYSNSLTKRNRFGTTVINAAINDDYKNLDALLQMFKKSEPVDRYEEVFAFTIEHRPELYNKVEEVLGEGLKERKNNNHPKKETMKKVQQSHFLKILNNEKVVIKKSDIGFENFIKPLFLYNHPFYAKVPDSFLRPFSKELIKLFIKTNSPVDLITFINRNDIKLEDEKLGAMAVQYAYSDLEGLVDLGIDLDFRLKNNYTYFNNLILSRSIGRLSKLLADGKKDITTNELFETKHILDMVFAFDDINILKNIKRDKKSEYSGTFFAEKYKYFIENNKFKEFQMYIDNEFFSRDDLKIYAEILSKNEDKTNFFKALYSNDLDFDTKTSIVENILAAGKIQTLGIIKEGDLKTILSSEGFLQPILKKMTQSNLTRTVKYLISNGHTFKMPTIAYLYSIEAYPLIQEIYENMTPLNVATIKGDLLTFISSLKENKENMNLFMFAHDRFYKDDSISRQTLINSVKDKGRFMFLIRKSKLKVEDYQDIFGHLLSKNPKHTMFRTILEHPVGTNISFNKYFEDKHLLEIMLEKDLEEMFNLTLLKLKDSLDKKVTEDVMLKLLELNKLNIYNNNLALFNGLISKHGISPIPLFMTRKYNLAFTAYALKNNENVQLLSGGEHPIFSIFRKSDISNVDKIKLFYLYKEKKINILEKDLNNKSIFHYLTDFSIKESNLSNLISKIPEDIRLRYLEKSALFNYIVESGKEYTGIIRKNLNEHRLVLTKTEVPFPLKVIEAKNRELFNFLLEELYVDTEMEDATGKSILRYAIETGDMYYLDTLVSLGSDVSEEDVEFAKTLDLGEDIVGFLEDKSTFIYKIQRYVNMAVHNRIFRWVGTATLLLGIAYLLMRRRREMQRRREIEEGENRRKNMSPEELRLQELKDRVRQLSLKNEEEELDQEVIKSIEEEFEEINKNKTNSIMDLDTGSEPVKKEDKKNFSQEELAERLNEINHNLEEFEIPAELMKELEDDFGSGEESHDDGEPEGENDK